MNNGDNKKIKKIEPDEIEETPEDLEKIPPEYKKLILRHLKYSGPLPPPTDLKQYEAILGGFANRLLKIHEQEQNFRQELSEKILSLIREKNKNGQILSFALSVISIFAGTFLAYTIGTIPSIAPFSIGVLGFISKIINSFMSKDEQ